jgi:MurNAc alpha-1-phosphate uridylyltransferase
MVFAAGLGTRMGALTRDRPKPLIDHALAVVRGAGVPRVVVNVHAHAAQMRVYLARAAPEVLVSVEEAERLETGGGLKRALPLLGTSPVFGLNADMVWRGANPFLSLAAAWEPGRMDALLCLVPRAAATGHGGAGDFFRAADGRLARRGAAEAADYVYAGAQIIDTRRVAEVPEAAFSLNRVWDAMLAEGRLFGVVHAGGWADVGTPEGIALAEAELAR